MSIALTLSNIDRIRAWSATDKLTYPEKAGMFAALEFLCADVYQHIDEQGVSDVYRPRIVRHRV